MSKNFIISYDLGTSGNKATLFDEECNLIASCFYGYKTCYPKPGWAQQNQEDWLKSLKKTTVCLFDKTKDLKKYLSAVTFSGQMMNCCPVNKEGEPLFNSIIWSDQRAYLEKEFLKKVLSDDFAYKNTGNIFCANYTAAKIMWLKKTYPQIYKNTYKFLQAKDFLAYFLTGKAYTDYSDASGTNLFDINRKIWHEEILNVADIDKDKLPQAVKSSTVIGTVNSNASKYTGLPEGTPVVIGGGDGPCATVGAGATAKNSCYNIFGSSSWNSITTSSPLYDKEMRTFILNHLDPNLYMAIGVMQSAGTSIEWLSNWLGINVKMDSTSRHKSIYAFMDEIGMGADPCSKGTMFLPYIMGERTPYWDTQVKGAFLGLTMVTGQKEIIRAVMEGIIYHLRLILEILEENVNEIPAIRLIGGGGKSLFIQELMSNIWGKKIITMKYMDEATSIGAAIAALVALGIKKSFFDAESLLKKTGTVIPDNERFIKYTNYYKVFLKAYNDLKSVNGMLDELQKKDV